MTGKTPNEDVFTPSKMQKLGKQEINIAVMDALSSALKTMDLKNARQTEEAERDIALFPAADEKGDHCSL